MNKQKDWVYTLNNYDENDIARLRKLECVWHVMGYEVGKTCGTPHIQGYIYFKNQRHFKAVKKLIGDRAHVERRSKKSTVKEASEYSMKDGKFETHGEMPGCRADGGRMEQDRWADARTAVLEGRYDDVPADIEMRCVGNYKRMRELRLKPVEPLPESETYGLWLWGEPRVGKSHYARNQFPNLYMKGKNKWWDGYHGQENVLIDEVDQDDAWMASSLKMWADRWPFQAEYKGGRMEARPKLIIVTSNYSIDEIFLKKKDYDAIKARFVEKEFTIEQRL